MFLLNKIKYSPKPIFTPTTTSSHAYVCCMRCWIHLRSIQWVYIVVIFGLLKTSADKTIIFNNQSGTHSAHIISISLPCAHLPVFKPILVTLYSSHTARLFYPHGIWPCPAIAIQIQTISANKHISPATAARASLVFARSPPKHTFNKCRAFDIYVFSCECVLRWCWSRV